MCLKLTYKTFYTNILTKQMNLAYITGTLSITFTIILIYKSVSNIFYPNFIKPT